ncbi:hypothetical protein LINGRAHAP2_LOCUS28776 [Linum grandiflorum]
MASFSKNMINSLLVTSIIILLIMMISTAESTNNADCTVTCSSWVAVPTGASCYSISDAHKITMSKFQSLNPNLVCSKLFAKQWVCVVGIGC